MAANFSVLVGLVLASSALGAQAAVAHSSRGQGFLEAALQPEAAARTLAAVEDEWQAQASLFAACSVSKAKDQDARADCSEAPEKFGKSCGTVVQAVVRGAGGDRDDVRSYLSEVCNQSVLQAQRKHQDRCLSLAESINVLMQDDAMGASTDISKVCSSFFTQVVHEIKQEQARRHTEEGKSFEAMAASAESEAKAQEEEEARAKEFEEAQAKALEEGHKLDSSTTAVPAQPAAANIFAAAMKK